MDKPILGMPILFKTVKMPLIKYPSKVATGPIINVEVFVNKIPDIFSSWIIMERDHTRLLKKDYISIFSMRPTYRPLMPRIFL